MEISLDNKSQENFDKLVVFLKEMNEFTSVIQNEISASIILDPAKRDELSNDLKGSEESMQKKLDNAAYHFLSVLPLASMNRSNMFMSTMSFHSNLTNNQILSEAIDKVNEVVAEDF